MSESDNREVMEFDVVIVGGGPSGLATAIRLAQLAREADKEANICLLDKGSEIGAHILSGAVIEPRALDELIPNWKELGAPLNTAVTSDSMLLLGEKAAIKLPVLPYMRNDGNYIISLGNLCRWLAQQAESMGVQIFAGFPAADVIIEDSQVKGVITGEFGVAKDGSHKDSYQPAMELRAKYTVFAEGCRGHISEKLIQKFNLRKDAQEQTYGIGIKELWEVDPSKHQLGAVQHTIGWPLDTSTYGGSFIYHMENNQLAIGFVIGLDYENPRLSPYMEFQKFKTHPKIKELLEGGRRISYGARALNEGGFQSVPRLAFAGGVLVGCAAGFLNVAKIKGTHTAMKSGMLAAESIFDALHNSKKSPTTLKSYEKAIRKSWIYDELYKVRNIRPAFKDGLFAGMIMAAIDSFIFRGRAPWTLQHRGRDDQSFKPANRYPYPKYPEIDGKIVFDRLESVALSATNHEENQPCHLKLADKSIPIERNLAIYDAPETRYCPAGVYEIVEDEDNNKHLQINAQNCLHCKTCDIKDDNITWTPPEGGGGPNYPNM